MARLQQARFHISQWDRRLQQQRHLLHGMPGDLVLALRQLFDTIETEQRALDQMDHMAEMRTTEMCLADWASELSH